MLVLSLRANGWRFVRPLTASAPTPRDELASFLRPPAHPCPMQSTRFVACSLWMAHWQSMSVLIHGGKCMPGVLSVAALRPGDWSKQLVATLSTTGSDRPGVCAGCSSPASAADFNNRNFWASAELFYCRACWDQWQKAPRNINSSISGADCPEVLLVAVGDNLASLSEKNLRTAIHRLSKIAGWGGSLQIATDTRFEGLLNRICETQLSVAGAYQIWPMV